MNKVKEIEVFVKRVQTQRVVISENNGYDIPENPKDFVEFINSVLDDVETEDDLWDTEEQRVIDWSVK